MRKNSSFFAAATAVACSVLAITSCRSGDPDARAAAIPAARVAVAQRGDISRELTIAGQFQPYQVVDVHPKVSGYMRQINVDIGDIVRQGQILAVLEVPELNAQLEQSVFEVKQSQEEIARAAQEIKRTQALNYALHAQSVRLQQAAATRPGLIAQQELDDAQAKDLSSQAQIDAAKATMAAALQHAEAARSENERVQALEDYTHVTAPIAGVVIWRYADTGALIQGGTNSNDATLPIVRLSQSTLLRLRIPVPEDDVKFVHEGDALQVRVDAINRSFDGKIVRFTRNVNFETRTMETEVDVENKDLSIAPGMYANTALQLAHVSGAITIPIEALVLAAHHQETVYVLDSSNHISIRNVQVGIRGSKLAQITSGLSAGERVIIGGQEKYHAGEEAEPLIAQEPASETVQESGGMIDMKAQNNNSGEPE